MLRCWMYVWDSPSSGRSGVPSLLLELLVHTSKFETLMKKYAEPFGIYTNSSLITAYAALPCFGVAETVASINVNVNVNANANAAADVSVVSRLRL